MKAEVENFNPSARITSPVRMLAILIVVVFCAELTIMIVFSRLPPIPNWLESLLDALLLVVIISPVLYYALFQPLTRIIADQKRAEAELLEYRRRLEQTVETRTQELKEVKITADSELAGRKIAGLRRLYATLSHINRASRHAKNWEELFRETCKGAVEHGKFDLAWAGLIGHATHLVTPFCYSGREDGYLKNIRISIDDNVPEGMGPTGLAAREKRVVFVNDARTDKRVAPWREQLLQHGFLSLATLPITSGSSAIGVLVLYSGDAGLFEDDQLQLMEDMSFEISYALENFEREAAHSNAEEERQRALALTQKALHDSIQAIAYTLEIRDPYTAGHQRQVSQIATALAREMELPEEMIEGIHFGSLIHDLGKIALPAEILTRPRRLTPLEMQLIETHPEAGYEIVKNIDYPWPVADMIYQHHERMDGSGYPRGLKGDDILLESRILAVADVVDAMTSHRPYRAGLGIDKALAEIERGRGNHYDAMVADACLRLFREKGFKYT
jgi:response regulator RpfG family c-di-GMP phosphodiesterase